LAVPGAARHGLHYRPSPVGPAWSGRARRAPHRPRRCA